MSFLNKVFLYSSRISAAIINHITEHPDDESSDPAFVENMKKEWESLKADLNEEEANKVKQNVKKLLDQWLKNLKVEAGKKAEELKKAEAFYNRALGLADKIFG